MSSQVFSAELLKPLSAVLSQRLDELQSLDDNSEAYRALSSMPSGLHLDTFQDDDSVSLQIEAGSSVSFEFFEHVYEVLAAADAEFTTVKLFDSSTATTHFWESAVDLDIDYEGKHVALLGDLDEEDIIEALDESIIQTQVDAQTQIVIVGDGADSEQLQQAQLQNVIQLSEDDFWETMESFC